MPQRLEPWMRQQMLDIIPPVGLVIVDTQNFIIGSKRVRKGATRQTQIRP